MMNAISAFDLPSSCLPRTMAARGAHVSPGASGCMPQRGVLPVRSGSRPASSSEEPAPPDRTPGEELEGKVADVQSHRTRQAGQRLVAARLVEGGSAGWEIPPEGDTVQIAAASGVLSERSPDHPGRKEEA